MDQVKVGKFIASRRKENNLTQMQLAEKLNITDRAVSKWENGKAMPDSSIMLELCELLKISVNELLCGEMIEMNDYEKKLEENLLEMIKEKEEKDKRLLDLEIIMGILCLIPMFAAIIIIGVTQMEEWVKTYIIIAGILPILIATPFAIMIEQKAGYYECQKCHHKYIPEYKQVFLSAHYNRTRYMKCPKCNQRSWNKKVISKE